MGDPGDGPGKRCRDGTDQNVVVSDVREFVRNYALELVIIHELQQSFSDRDGSMPRVSTSCKSIWGRFWNYVELRHREACLGGQTLHRFVKPGHLLTGNSLRAAGGQSDFVREKVCEGI